MEVVRAIRKEYGLDAEESSSLPSIRALQQTLGDALRKYVPTSSGIARLILFSTNHESTFLPIALLTELVEHADDSSYPDEVVVPTLVVKLHEMELIVRSNDSGLTEEDIRLLCGLEPSVDDNDSRGRGTSL